MPLVKLLCARFALPRGARFRFFHGPTLYAFLCDRLGHAATNASFPKGCRLLACETGRVRFEPGEFYHFGLVLTRNCEITEQQWAKILRRRPRERAAARREVPLGATARFVELVDVVGNRVLDGTRDATGLTLEAVDRAVATLADAQQVAVRFDSPLLILRTPVQRRDTFFDDRYFNAETFLDRVAQACDEHFPELVPASPPPGVVSCINDLVRAETHYHGAKGVKILPGACGSVTLEFDAPLGGSWARALVLAGLVGVGKTGNMGQGRFSVVGYPVCRGWPPKPALDWLSRIARPKRFDAARDGIARGGPTPGTDGVERQAFLESLTYREPLLLEALAKGEIRPAPLRGILLKRSDGGIRPLAVPTLEDRFYQRACLEELMPAFDELLEESSFAYRRGLSRRNAELSVRRAHDEGFRHVLDADLKAFFDTVNHELLERRLSAYLGEGPIVRLLMSWVRAPIEYDERLIQRTEGLPQGAPLSPLLANVYLDSFDEAMEAMGFRLVRYADDFVVLCRSAEDLARARQVVEAELARLKLELSQAKTESTSFDRGFDFLGYVFCRSISLQPERRSKKRIADDSAVVKEEELKQLDPRDVRGWLAEWLALDAQGRQAKEPEARAFRTPLVPRAPERRSVYIVEPGLRVAASRRGLRVMRGDVLLDELAWQTLSEIVIVGGHYLTSNVYQQALRHRVPVALYTRSAVPLGLVLPNRVRTPSPLTRLHWKWHEETEERLKLSRSLIEAKIHNQRLVARYQPGDTEALRQRLLEAGQGVLRAESVERIRGLEGVAAHAYFAAWRSWVPEELGFAGRTGRGATDPTNAVLNLLYTQLFRLCWLSALSHGLDPYLGVLHEGNERYAALAADLQEPFRFLCERLALELFRRGTLKRDDFIRSEKRNPPLRLKTEALKRTLTEWEKRLEARVQFGDETRSYRGHIAAQAERCAQIVRGERAELSAFRLKW